MHLRPLSRDFFRAAATLRILTLKMPSGFSRPRRFPVLDGGRIPTLGGGSFQGPGVYRSMRFQLELGGAAIPQMENRMPALRLRLFDRGAGTPLSSNKALSKFSAG